jgi:hypothetical protein
MPTNSIILSSARVTIVTDEVSIEMDNVSGSFAFITNMENISSFQDSRQAPINSIIHEQKVLFEGVSFDMQSVIITKKTPSSIFPDGLRAIRIEKGISGSGEKP